MYFTTNIPMIDVKTIKNINGYTPESTVEIKPAKYANKAPKPNIIAPPIPDALPAKLGRTDNNPALALGKTIPLPMPAQIIQPKNTIGCSYPKRNIIKATNSPITVIHDPYNNIN